MSEPNPSPSRRDRRDIGGIVIGLIILGIGAYFLLRETLQISLPDIGQLWPIIVIVVGAAVLYGGLRRNRA